jgi:hypothetical protein
MPTKLQLSLLIAGALLTACPSASRRAEDPAPPQSHQAGATMNSGPPSAPAREVSPGEIEIVEGAPVRLPDGLTLDVRGVMYAHLAGSDNHSMCVLIVRAGGATEELTLARLHSKPPTFVELRGWRVALEYADPYQQPSRVMVHIEPRPDAP